MVWPRNSLSEVRLNIEVDWTRQLKIQFGPVPLHPDQATTDKYVEADLKKSIFLPNRAKAKEQKNLYSKIVPLA